MTKAKKILFVLLALICISSLCSCGEQDAVTPKDGVSSSEADNQDNDKDGQKVPEKDEVAIEEAKALYYDNPNDVHFAFKIRNLSEEKFDLIDFHFQLLDSNGDILETLPSTGIENLDPGQGGWGNNSAYNYNNYDEVAKLRIVSYSIGDSAGPGNFITRYEKEFDTPIIFNKEDISIEQD